MQTLRITLKDKTKITIEDAKEIKASISGSILVIAKDKTTSIKVNDIAKYELVESK